MRRKLSKRGRSALVGEHGLLEHLEARALLGGDPFPDIGLMEDQSNPVLRLHTTYGAIDIEVLANRDPVFAAFYLEHFDYSHESFFHNVVPGVALEAGRLSYVDPSSFVREFAGPWQPSTVSPPIDNLARTITAVSRQLQVDPFTTYYSTAFRFNLQDNAPPAGAGEYAVIARVLGDDAWDVVQTIAGLTAVDFGPDGPFPNRNWDTPITGAWTPGNPVPRDLLVHIENASIIKAQDVEDFYTHSIYSAEGFTGETINEFVPIENPNDETVHYEVWARYEPVQGLQHSAKLIARGTIDANSRGGITVSTVDNWQQAPVAHGVPYAIEVRSTLPVAATLSHYDFGAATGEAFTGETSEKWTFVGLSISNTSRSFLLWYNPGDEAVDVTVTLGGANGTTEVHQFTVEARRRGGMSLADVATPGFDFNATIESTGAIVAQLSAYEADGQLATGAWTTLGMSGDASTVGVMPLAIEPNAVGNPRSIMTFKMYNPGAQIASVIVELYAPGSTTPITFLPDPVNVDAGGFAAIEFPILEEHPIGSFTLVYRSDVPIYGAVEMVRHEDRYQAQMAMSAGTEYHFAEGFSDPARTERNVLEEYITIFNPNAASFGATDTDANIVFTFRYTDGTTFTIQRIVDAGTSEHIEISALQEVIDQANLHDRFFYSVEVTSDIPIVAQMLHTDATLGDPDRATGGFSTLGTLFGARVRLDELSLP